MLLFSFTPMDLLSDIPDFVRSEIFSSTAQTSPTTTTHHSPFWQKWHELGLVVEKCVTPETSFQELTLRDLLASLPCGSVQATDANGFWSSTAFPSHFKFTTHSHFLSTGSRTGIAYDPRPGLTFVLESPCAEVHIQSQTVKIPKITNAATFVFLLQHFQLNRGMYEDQQRRLNASFSMEMEMERDHRCADEADEADDEADGGGGGGEVHVTYSAIRMPEHIDSVPPTDSGIVYPTTTTASKQQSSTVVDLDSYLARWKRGETNGRSGKPTAEKIAEMAGISQLELKKWLTAKGTTWTQMLIKHGFRDGK